MWAVTRGRTTGRVGRWRVARWAEKRVEPLQYGGINKKGMSEGKV